MQSLRIAGHDADGDGGDTAPKSVRVVAKFMDLRRVEKLIALARRMGVSRLSITDGGMELELGPLAVEQAPVAAAPARRRVNTRDSKSVDDYLAQRFKGGSSESS
jgi:hypothetical protein